LRGRGHAIRGKENRIEFPEGAKGAIGEGEEGAQVIQVDRAEGMGRTLPEAA